MKHRRDEMKESESNKTLADAKSVIAWHPIFEDQMPPI